MNKLNEIFSTTFTDALGWTLFHSLWQGALVAFTLYIFLIVFGKTRTNMKYLACLSALSSILVISIITFIYQLNIEKSVVTGTEASLYHFQLGTTPVSNNLEINNASGFTAKQILATIQSQIPLLLLGWLIGVIIAAFKLTGGYFYMKRKIGKALSNCPDELKQLLPKLTQQLKLNKVVRICEVSFLKTPAIFGHLKPIILIPIGLVNHLTPQQVEMVILHEIAHIKRNDFLANLIQSTLEVIFFFNPAIWWISREIRQERENCCDDLIMQVQDQPVQYIKTLAAVNHFNASGFKLLPGFFGNGQGQLLKRMQRLVGTGTSSYSPQMYKVASLLIILLSFLYFGWINKNQSLQPEKSLRNHEPTRTVQSQFGLVPSDLFGLIPFAEADTVKEEKILEQEIKIKEQEAVIRDLEAKIEAMETRKKERVEKRLHDWSREDFNLESIKQRLMEREQLDLTLELKEQIKSQLKEVNFERMKDMRLMFNDTPIKVFQDLVHLDHLEDNATISSEIQERLEAISEELAESFQEFDVSVLEEVKLNDQLLKEMLQMEKLELEEIKINMQDAMESVKDELNEFSIRMEHFEDQLLASLKEDEIINDKAEKVKITQKNGRITINGQKLSEELSKKYKTMIEKEFGGKHWDDDFNLKFNRSDWD